MRRRPVVAKRIHLGDLNPNSFTSTIEKLIVATKTARRLGFQVHVEWHIGKDLVSFYAVGDAVDV